MKRVLPKNLDQLKILLGKLKDEEIKLEASIALKQHPEIEKGIISVVIAMSDVKLIDYKLRIMVTPKDQVFKQIEDLEFKVNYYARKREFADSAGQAKLVELYESRIESMQEKIKDLRDNPDVKFEKFKADRRDAVLQLRREFDIWKKDFEKAKFRVHYFLPALRDMLKM